MKTFITYFEITLFLKGVPGSTSNSHMKECKLVMFY